MNTLRATTRHFTLTLLGSVLICTGAMAGPSSASPDAQARYRHDMAVCESGQSNQALNVCRTEARNALAAAKRGGLIDESQNQYTRNALNRCTAFQGDDRAACEARILNPSRVEGSVGGGGLLRESVQIVPGK
ncbi:MAG: hypothetical protein ABIZ09_14785 [Rhodoferax sp.]|jgi:hypothetical protein